MQPITCSLPSSPPPPSCCRDTGYGECDVELCQHAARLAEAIQLVRLGARVGLICQLTGLDKAPINRLYRQIRGTPSPSGLMPFSDTWYRESDVRHLHTTILWKLYQQLGGEGDATARQLIQVFRAYTRLVREPLIDLTHAAFVPRLVTMKLWEERCCRYCRLAFLAPVDMPEDLCPACRLYRRHRCSQCHAPLQPQAKGRRRLHCEACARRSKRRGTLQ